MSLKAFMAKPKNKLISVIVATAILVSSVAITLGSVFAFSNPETWSAEAFPTEGFTGDIVDVNTTAYFSAPSVREVGRYVSNDKMQAVYDKSEGEFIITPQAAGSSVLAFGNKNSGEVFISDFWVRDNSKVAAYEGPANWTIEIKRGESEALSEYFTAQDGNGNNVALDWYAANDEAAKLVDGNIVAGDTNGMAFFVSSFTDIWGEAHTLFLTIVVGKGTSSDILEDSDGNYYVLIDEENHVYIVTDEDGKPLNPPAYYADTDDDGTPDTQVYPDADGGWTENNPADHECVGEIVKIGDDHYILTGLTDGDGNDLYLKIGEDGKVVTPLEYYTIVDGVATPANVICGSCEALQALLDTANGRIDELDGLLAAANSRIDELEGLLDAANGQVTTLTNTVTQLQQQIITLTELLEDDSEVTALLEQIAQLEADLDEANDTINTMQGQLDAKDLTIGALDAEIDRLNGLLNTANSTISTLEGQIATLSGQLDDKDAEIAALNGTITDLRDQIETLEGQLATATTTITGLQGLLAEKETIINGLNSTINTLNDEIDDMRDALDAKDAEIADLNEDIDALNDQIDDLNAQILALQAQLDAKDGDIATLQAQITALQSQLEAKDGQITTLQGQITILEGEKTALEGQITTLQGQITQLEGEKTALEGQITTLTNQLEGKDTTIAGLQETITTLQGTIETLNNTITDLQTQLANAVCTHNHGRIVKDGNTYYISTGQFDGASSNPANEVFLLLEGSEPDLVVKHDLEYYKGVPGNPTRVYPDGSGGWTEDDPSLSYTASVDPTSKTFDAAIVDYGAQTAQQFTITNTGTGTLKNVTATLASATNFQISTALSSSTINVGGTATVSVRPKTGLAVGDYTTTLQIRGNNGFSIDVALSFTVDNDSGGRTITVAEDDNATWLEIATKEVGGVMYSLIVRRTVLGIGTKAFRTAGGNVYDGSNLKQDIDNWFNDMKTANSVLYQNAAATDAVTKVGKTATTEEEAHTYADGFSSPLGTMAKDLSGDATWQGVAFPLSYQEAANYCSLYSLTSPNNDSYPSSTLAQRNWNALEVEQPLVNSWLRSPGTSSPFACGLNGNGYVLFLGNASSATSFCVRPALWVASSILEP